ncbi:unnamed protein product [Adineta steineri]|uniref:Uncharacterized protein n=1 Tax=Adineta steineri TaxID=433720 RepID=A0A813PK48_9BILA|nr:unnamed protein product [Adineta steineri]CAF4101186.1 unnamed protein product [Adineta steineri]
MFRHRSWTQYSQNFTATKTTHTLLFGFETDGNRVYYLDTVSVANGTVGLASELLTNGNFESSAVTLIAWTTWCESTCGVNNIYITSGTDCFMSVGNCFTSWCSNGRPSFVFLGQSITTTIGQTYAVSYRLIQTGPSSSGTMKFYVDIN